MPLRQTVELFVQHVQKKSAVQEGRDGTQVGGRRKVASSNCNIDCSNYLKRSAASTARKSASTARKFVPNLAQRKQEKSQGRCGSCHWKNDHKTTGSCVSCRNWVCRDHTGQVCQGYSSLLSAEVIIVHGQPAGDELPRSTGPSQ